MGKVCLYEIVQVQCTNLGYPYLVQCPQVSLVSVFKNFQNKFKINFSLHLFFSLSKSFHIFSQWNACLKKKYSRQLKILP